MGFRGRSGGSTSTVVQVKNVETGAVASGSTVIPPDDTIPQNTEGDQYMTLAITPTSSTNKLQIDVVFICCVAAGGATAIVALFQDSTANALAAAWATNATSQGLNTITFRHYMTAGTTSATTFKVRAGPAAGAQTLVFNGQVGSRQMGGVFASSITIKEIVP